MPELGEGDYFLTTSAPHPEYGPIFKDMGPWEVIEVSEGEVYGWPVRGSNAEGDMVIREDKLGDHIEAGRIIPLGDDEVEPHESADSKVIRLGSGDKAKMVPLSNEVYGLFHEEDGGEWLEQALETKLASSISASGYTGSFQDFVREAIREELERRGHDLNN